jgi:hypothetical protein
MSRRDKKPEATPATEPETGEAETAVADTGATEAATAEAAEAEAQAAAALSLSLEDTMTQKQRGVPTKSRTGVVGYNPYDAEPAAKAKGADGKTKTDLRKLSEWIRLQRQVAELNPDAPKKKPPT